MSSTIPSCSSSVRRQWPKTASSRVLTCISDSQPTRCPSVGRASLDVRECYGLSWIGLTKELARWNVVWQGDVRHVHPLPWDHQCSLLVRVIFQSHPRPPVSPLSDYLSIGRRKVSKEDTVRIPRTNTRRPVRLEESRYLTSCSI